MYSCPRCNKWWCLCLHGVQSHISSHGFPCTLTACCAIHMHEPAAHLHALVSTWSQWSTIIGTHAGCGASGRRPSVPRPTRPFQRVGVPQPARISFAHGRQTLYNLTVRRWHTHTSTSPAPCVPHALRDLPHAPMPCISSSSLSWASHLGQPCSAWSIKPVYKLSHRWPKDDVPGLYTALLGYLGKEHNSDICYSGIDDTLHRRRAACLCVLHNSTTQPAVIMDSPATLHTSTSKDAASQVADVTRTCCLTGDRLQYVTCGAVKRLGWAGLGYGALIIWLSTEVGVWVLVHDLTSMPAEVCCVRAKPCGAAWMIQAGTMHAAMHHSP